MKLFFLQTSNDIEHVSIEEFAHALDKLWWLIIVCALIYFALRPVFSGLKKNSTVTSKPKNETTKPKVKWLPDDEFHRRYPTVLAKQQFYNDVFEEDKTRTENKWNDRRSVLLKIGVCDISKIPNEIISSFDIYNLDAWAAHVRRYVVVESNDEKGYKLKTEWWTYDGRWRMGYWKKQNKNSILFDTKTKSPTLNNSGLDSLWEECIDIGGGGFYHNKDADYYQNGLKNEKCDFLDRSMGDFHPPE